jgi:Holliday junction resolvase
MGDRSGLRGVTNSNKDKGDEGEREVQALLQELLGLPARRALGAGRKDDVGDIDNVPNTAIQVARTKIKYLTSVINTKTRDVESQRRNRRVRFAASFIRWDYGREWIVVLTPQQFARLWKYAQIGLKHERELRRASTLIQPAAKMPAHVRNRPTHTRGA